MDACHLHATLRLLCAGRRATIDPSPPAAAPVSQAGDDKRWEVSLRENSSGKFLKFSEAKQSLWNKVSGTRGLRALPCECMHMAGRVRMHAWMHAHACTPHATFATASSLASCVSHPLNMIHTRACNAGDMWSRAHCMWGGCTKPLCPNPRVSGGRCSVHRCRPCPTRCSESWHRIVTSTTATLHLTNARSRLRTRLRTRTSCCICAFSGHYSRIGHLSIVRRARRVPCTRSRNPCCWRRRWRRRRSAQRDDCVC